MSKPKLTARTGDTLSAIARLTGSENHKGFDILHANGYVVAYVIPIDEDGIEGGKLARQFAAAPEMHEALEGLADQAGSLLAELDYQQVSCPLCGEDFGDGDDALCRIVKALGETSDNARALITRLKGEM